MSEDSRAWGRALRGSAMTILAGWWDSSRGACHKGVIIGGASLTEEEANKEISDSNLDLVTWGRAILANPDFVIKLKNNDNLTEFSNEMDWKGMGCI